MSGTRPRGPGLRTALDLGRLELISAFRAKVFNATFFIQPVIFLAIIAIGIVSPKVEEAKASEKVTNVAVHVAVDAGPGPRALYEALRADPPPKLVFRDEADPIAVVGAERAEAGLIVDAGTIRTVSLPSVAKSRLGLTRLRDALATAEVRRTEATGVSVSKVTTTTVDLQKSSRGRRLALGDIVPLYLLLQLMTVGVSAMTAIRGDKDNRSIEGLLTLPAPRWSLLAGKTVGVFVEGVARLAVLAVVIVAATRTSIMGLRLEIAPVSLLTMLVGGVAIVASSIGIGAACGVAARSSGQEAAAGGVLTISGVAAGIAISQMKVAGGSLAVRFIPFVGPVLAIRGVIFGALGALDVTIACLASVAFGALALALAAKLLERDGLTLRDS